MELNNVVVADRHELDDSICVKADYHGERVFAEIPRIALDDYFPSRLLTHAGRRSLVESNKEAIGATMQRKCEQQAWRLVTRAGSTIKQLEFDEADLFSGPRLTDAPLRMEESADFQTVRP